MKTFTLTVLLSILVGPAQGAINIVDQKIQPLGEFQKRAVPFLEQQSGIQVMVGSRTLYTTRISNQDKTIVALNFHGASDYDGVDILLENTNKIFAINDLWSLLEDQLVKKKMLADQNWHRLSFQVKSVDGHNLKCEFRGESPNSDLTTQKTITVTLMIKNDVLSAIVSP